MRYHETKEKYAYFDKKKICYVIVKIKDIINTYITQSIKMLNENVMGTPLEKTLARKGPAIIIPTYSRSYTHKHKSYLQQEKAVVRKINTMQRLQWGQGGAATCIITCPHFKKLHMPLLWKYLSQKVISYHTGRQQ